MLAFTPNPNSFPDVNHLTAGRGDNRLENLEWASKQRNMRHAYDFGLNRPHLGIENGMGKFTDDQVREIRILSELGISGADISRYYGVTKTLISRILLRRTYKHVQ